MHNFLILQRNLYDVQLFIKFAVINQKGIFAVLAPSAEGQEEQLPPSPQVPASLDLSVRVIKNFAKIKRAKFSNENS